VDGSSRKDLKAPYSARLVLYIQEEWESIDHLLHHCEVTRELWVVMFHLFGVE
jgi:hypothetical protein